MTNITIRSATVDDAKTLTDICFRSKAHWGYSQEYIDVWVDELIITVDIIKTWDCFAAVNPDDHINGFCVLKVYPPVMEIDALYVDPNAMGSGTGRLLLDHAHSHASSSGCTALELDSDPNALPFYQHMGGKKIGDTLSTVIPGRTLPRVRFELLS